MRPEEKYTYYSKFFSIICDEDKPDPQPPVPASFKTPDNGPVYALSVIKNNEVVQIVGQLKEHELYHEFEKLKQEQYLNNVKS